MNRVTINFLDNDLFLVLEQQAKNRRVPVAALCREFIEQAVAGLDARHVETNSQLRAIHETLSELPLLIAASIGSAALVKDNGGMQESERIAVVRSHLRQASDLARGVLRIHKEAQEHQRSRLEGQK